MPTYSDGSMSIQQTLPVQAASSGNDLPNLDFMRAIAVLLVLFGHFTYYHGLMDFGPLSTTWMGSLGVKMFFVHTCFVLMRSIERQWRKQSTAKLLCSFMVRRIFRIYPLSVFVVSSVVLFRLPMAELHREQFIPLPLHPAVVISNLLLVQSPSNSILGPTWSLPYEMAMYLLLPSLFLVLYPNKSLGLIGAIWLFSLVVGLALLPPAAREHIDFLLYVPCFLPGVIAYQLQRIPRPHYPSFFWPLGVIGLVLLYLLKQNFALNTWLKSWAVCLALGVGAPFFAQISAPWLTIPSRLIARYSYGIYLTHFFCIWLPFDRLHYVLPRIVRLPLFAALVTLLPILLFHFLEEPMTLLGKRVANRFESGPKRA